MPTLTGRLDALARVAAGKGAVVPMASVSPTSSTSPAAGSGSFNFRPQFNTIGTTLPLTREGMVKVDADGLFTGLTGQYNNGAAPFTGGAWLGWLYFLGDLLLNATGNQFTEYAAGQGPFLRTVMGQASQPISLTPMLYVTVASTTTAGQFYVRNATGPGNGYYDQDGNYTEGSVLFTCPSATTAANGNYVLMLNDGDSAVQRITHVDVTVAAGGSAAGVLLGFEPVAFCNSGSHELPYGAADLLHSGPCMTPLRPAVATSGTTSAVLAIMQQGSTTGPIFHGIYTGVENT